ncbi:hypothetical protein K32_16040 [Kaistia sp. 32K]|uniref:hypothetical protein n=1 Tax=Kaistia sp. 32K TaxID=2795690 RepID=UPI001915155B|nr:hypothetical protein [Kaistia sp. 32K]BCP52987.1 hypothetical protein K32_16040 [Kaistia sp. 32K]
MQKKTLLLLAVATAVLVSGCQSSQQSMDSAYVTCANSGIRPGSWEHERCTRNVYEENRRKADQAAAAVAVGVAAGAVGAYAISQAEKDRKDRRDRRDWRPPVRDRNSPSMPPRDRDNWQRPGGVIAY